MSGHHSPITHAFGHKRKRTSENHNSYKYTKLDAQKDVQQNKNIEFERAFEQLEQQAAQRRNAHPVKRSNVI